MTVTTDNGYEVNEDLRGFNLMNLPLETLLHVIEFLPMEDIVNFAFVCRKAFQATKGLTWEHLSFLDGRYWLKDVEYLCNRAQATCQSLTVSANFRLVLLNARP